MQTEVYRSFDGKLDVDHQLGYIIYELDNFYEILFLSVWRDTGDSKFRVRKDFLTPLDFPNFDKITSLQEDILCGRADTGQYFYKGKWYGYDTICKIQMEHQDYNWRHYV